MDQKSKADLFRRLHSGPDILVLPNAWDAISARILEVEGFPAAATGSAGVAAVLGYPDGERIPRTEMIFMVARIAAAVNVPLTADVEAGYGDLAGTACEVIAAGAVGMNLEDMVDHDLVPLAEQLDKIRAVKAAAEASGVPLVLNARTDIFLAKHGDEATRFDRAVGRLNAFHDAGADCLFAPGVVDAATIGRLVSSVKGPLNILAGIGTQRVILGTLQRFARRIRGEGTLTQLATEAVSYAEIQQLLTSSPR